MTAYWEVCKPFGGLITQDPQPAPFPALRASNRMYQGMEPRLKSLKHNEQAPSASA